MIIAIKDNDRIVMGYTSEGLSPSRVTEKENAGIWKVKGNPHTLIGISYTSIRSDVIRYEEDIFQGELNFKTVNGRVRKKIDELFAAKPYLANSEISEPCMIIAQNNDAFSFDKQVIFECDDFLVLGYDESLARGVLESTKGLPAEERIIQAFMMVNDGGYGRAFPILVMDTKTMRRKIISDPRLKKQNRKTLPNCSIYK